MERIIAVVVSHNRHALLVEAIEAIRKQSVPPHDILVVNNGSADYTSVWLDSQDDIIQINQENKGSAGGYHAGISWAYQKGYHWIWCMDDDSLPEWNALEHLLQYRTENPILINSALLNKTDKNSFVWKTGGFEKLSDTNGKVIKGAAFPFNGTLINRSVIQQAGLPMPNLFFWGVEREYFYRITQQFRIPAITVTDSKHYHPPATYSHQNEWDYQTSWKMYFYVRNRLAVMQSQYGNKIKAVAHYIYFVLAFIWSIMKYQKHNKFRKMLFVFWPLKDAVLSRFNATPEFVMQRLKEKHRQSIPALMVSPLNRKMIALFTQGSMENSPSAAV